MNAAMNTVIRDVLRRNAMFLRSQLIPHFLALTVGLYRTTIRLAGLTYRRARRSLQTSPSGGQVRRGQNLESCLSKNKRPRRCARGLFVSVWKREGIWLRE